VDLGPKNPLASAMSFHVAGRAPAQRDRSTQGLRYAGFSLYFADVEAKAGVSYTKIMSICPSVSQ
jgi:hypothetical protein